MNNSKILSRLVEKDIQQAASIILDGGIVSYPTETYYGLGGDPFNSEAVEKLFTLKVRKRNKPISMIISDIGMLSKISETIPSIYLPLINSFWPGPLTLIFPAKKDINPLLTGGTGTIGVRISPHQVATKLSEILERPITATSANISGNIPGKNKEEVRDYFGNNIDYIVDGGTTKAGLCSTIVSYAGDELILLRSGEIAFEILQKKVAKNS